MSNEKDQFNAPDAVPASRAADVDATLPGARKPVAVVAFAIEENDDPGGDPYNHTGSFCVPEFSND
jgi:hypothetical protein